MLFSLEYLFHPADLPILKPHFDSVRVGWRIGEYILYDPSRQFSGSLIRLQYNVDLDAWRNILPVLAVH